MMQRLIMSVALLFIYTTAAFCLWSIGTQLVDRPLQALLLFPFGLRMGLLLQSPRQYWPGILLGDALLWWLLTDQFGYVDLLWYAIPLLLATTLLAVFASPWLLRHQKNSSEWQWPLMQGAVILAAALIQALGWQMASQQGAMALLLGLVGGFTIAPTCLLLWHYFARQIWLPLEPGLIHKPINLRLQHIMWYLLLFALSIWLQYEVTETDLHLFAPFCLAIPIVFMSYRYGWQGGAVATLLNGVVLLINTPAQLDSHRDLLLSLLAQSLTGLLLGAGIQRQRELNQQLQLRLNENRELAKALVVAEEHARRDVARELHDEVGQTVTVIRTQASIIKRLTAESSVLISAEMIETLALRVYDGVHDVLAKLWPAALNNLPLSAAVAALMRELIPQDHSVVGVLNWQLDDHPIDETLKITLYRICQEGVTNAYRHGAASRIEIDARQDNQKIYLTIRDNGKGIDLATLTPGYGLRGMQSRVSALGGSFSLSVDQGTCLNVILPTVSLPADEN
ncbi:signal transduction histidine-protein kinase/phosphatase UhpB [Yersinia mollaretii]|uniref:signal transduction histidine-protein kinase/phosphatase UhpB n=1 Tax=Yersinia mollaretii TaxID=33060 RepID=UPI0005E07D6B|nr:signal transduction histidine-protein kinase/phosphatase UhpB [Yersinia mollaretii]MDA5528786.1 signal transduction histidine-protein kinase/phosphatase UhpB [Yersinia mollaretii]MDR7875313.1 signal transduction histidine-protein kinase/phosphatase UhpB [Yersinia mollaretii]PHZ30338.1 signal transduction histidine-protein kinase/phosphatase UhpB [Yersinia mollaretii]WQC75244.1 signal transduction histidine-protein kinase/phosphatase UhpB [Yersinia mollaretii]CQJ28341.1 sensory histidine kin